MDTIKVATWNVRALLQKEKQLVREFYKGNTNFGAIRETKKMLKSTKIGNYAMIYREYLSLIHI